MDTSAHVSLGHETVVPSGIRAGLDVVLIGINYAPELAGIGPYTAGLSQHYAEQGHRVRVVTGVPHYPDWRRQRVNDSDRIRGNPTVARYWHFVPGRPDVFRRTVYELTWLASASRSLIGTRADAIIGVIPSLSGGILSLLLAMKLRRPYGLIFQDIVGSAANQSGYRGAVRMAGAAKFIEVFLARRAQAVAVVADGFRRYFEMNGVSPASIRRVRNWTRPNQPVESVSETRTRYGWKESDFVCLHAGNMGQKQALDNILYAARALAGSSIKIVLAGGGNDHDRLVEVVHREGLDTVSFLGVLADGRYEAALRAADVLVVNQRSSVEDMALPSKLTSYMAAARPIVAAVNPRSETAREIEMSGGGVVVQPELPSELARALRELARSPDVCRAMASRSQDYAANCLAAEQAFPAFDSFLECLVRAKVGSRETTAAHD